MLFIYDRDEIRAFWMKNVPMDLDIGFFDSNKKLVQWLTRVQSSGYPPILGY